MTGHLLDFFAARLRPTWARAIAPVLAARYERFGPLERLSLPGGTRLSVVAPHPDDESIGCGGLMALWSGANRDLEAVFLTRGEDGDPAARSAPPGPEAEAARRRVAARRTIEARTALMRLAPDATDLWLDGPDGALAASIPRLTEALREHWSTAPPDLVAAPFPADRHRDHVAAARIVAGALPKGTPVLAYEVWSAAPVNAVLDITGPAAEAKFSAIAAHESQTATTDYASGARALGTYRAVASGLGPGHLAEGYWRTDATGYAALVAALRV